MPLTVVGNNESLENCFSRIAGHESSILLCRWRSVNEECHELSCTMIEWRWSRWTWQLLPETFDESTNCKKSNRKCFFFRVLNDVGQNAILDTGIVDIGCFRIVSAKFTAALLLMNSIKTKQNLTTLLCHFRKGALRLDWLSSKSN